MTRVEFNLKYKQYLKERYNGLSIDDERFIKYLDEIFQSIILHHPKFNYLQVKNKWGHIRFYSNLDFDTQMKIEKILDNYYQTLINNTQQ